LEEFHVKHFKAVAVLCYGYTTTDKLTFDKIFNIFFVMFKEKSNQLDNSNVTILQVLPSLETGGVESGTVELALALKSQGFRPLVASRGGKLVQVLTQHNIEHIELPLHSKNPIEMIRNIFRLRSVIQKHAVNLMHARSRAPAWSARFACHLSKIPFVTTFHGTYNFHNNVKNFYNSVMVSGQRVVAISEFIKAHILANYSKRVEADRIRVIHRGIDLEKYARSNVTPARQKVIQERWQLKPKMPVILMPARLTGWKGQTVLIEALSLLKSQGYTFQCVLAGSAQGRTGYVQKLQNLVQSYELNDQVQIDQTCPDIPAGYTLADVVVHASTDPEAFGRVIVEAQAMEVPVIASNIGAPCEIIEDQKTGWLHQAGNAQDLADKLKDVLDLSQKDKARIVKQAQEKVAREYSNQLMFHRYIAVYKELLCR
jgi:glycosyltransferase involved in cell wall biosynthesis